MGAASPDSTPHAHPQQQRNADEQEHPLNVLGAGELRPPQLQPEAMTLGVTELLRDAHPPVV